MYEMAASEISVLLEIELSLYILFIYNLTAYPVWGLAMSFEILEFVSSTSCSPGLDDSIPHFLNVGD